MKELIVPGDLLRAAQAFVRCTTGALVILSGFPCCVDQTPPTETDGPPGAVAIGRAGIALGYPRVVLVTDDCNRDVFAAACEGTQIELESFPSQFSVEDEARLESLRNDASLLVACERAGPSQNGKCYTMRGIDMNEKGLIAPIHRLLENRSVPFIAVGDGGNELGMGKVFDKIVEHIPDGERIGCSLAADHLIAASVSNWGGYALAGAAAVVKSKTEADVQNWVNKCLPTARDEIELLDRCVAVGCRDGVSGKMQATVDGMPLERSLLCLQQIHDTSLGLPVEGE